MYTLASRSSRLQAVLYDGLYCLFPLLIVIAIGALKYAVSGQGFSYTYGSGQDTLIDILLIVMLWSCAGLSMFNFIQFVRKGQTWGKKRMKILVVQQSGEPASGGLLFWRSISSYVLSMIPLLGMLSFCDVWLIFGPARRCLHDYMAGTIVVEADSYRHVSEENLGFSRF